mgnify:CR=1 FL=1
MSGRYNDLDFDFAFEPMEPEGDSERVSRLSVHCYDVDVDAGATPVTAWELNYQCGTSLHCYTIRYRMTDLGKVVKTLIDWAGDEELLLTSGDVGSIMSILVGFVDGADSGEASY